MLDSEFDADNNRGALKLPNYSLTDLGANYRWDFSNDNSLNFRLNVNNIFDTVYIAEASTSFHVDSNTVDTWNGIDTTNNVWFGFGTTWNFSVSYNF